MSNQEKNLNNSSEFAFRGADQNHQQDRVSLNRAIAYSRARLEMAKHLNNLQSLLLDNSREDLLMFSEMQLQAAISEAETDSQKQLVRQADAFVKMWQKMPSFLVARDAYEIWTGMDSYQPLEERTEFIEDSTADQFVRVARLRQKIRAGDDLTACLDYRSEVEGIEFDVTTDAPWSGSGIIYHNGEKVELVEVDDLASMALRSGNLSGYFMMLVGISDYEETRHQITRDSQDVLDRRSLAIAEYQAGLKASSIESVRARGKGQKVNIYI